ncbi:MAG: preprotein translocase subunit SecG [Spirochaetales bacterium]|nr:preprotein translocase subunit SecG [Spirochaetales bacterium]
MGFLGIVLLVLFIINAILLILIVLMQDEQGEGIGGLFGGGSATPFGSRSGNVLTKVTSVLVAIFLILAFFLAFINKSDSDTNSILLENETTWWMDSAQDTGNETPAPEDNAAPASDGNN